MKISELLARVQITNDYYNCADFDDVALEFDIHESCNNYDLWKDNVKETHTASWNCTDTTVGMSVIFLFGEPVAICWQPARKSYKEFSWVSKEKFDAMHEYVKTFLEHPNPEPREILNLDEDISEFYKITYEGQVMNEDVYYKGERVTIIKNDNYYHFGLTKIQLPDNSIKEVLMEDLDFKMINLTGEV